MGVPVSNLDYAVAAVMGTGIALKMAAYKLALATPGLKGLADRRLTGKIRKLLARYGHAEFTTDAGAYRPATPAGAAHSH